MANKNRDVRFVLVAIPLIQQGANRRRKRVGFRRSSSRNLFRSQSISDTVRRLETVRLKGQKLLSG
jgi:hypothetical protein